MREHGCARVRSGLAGRGEPPPPPLHSNELTSDIKYVFLLLREARRLFSTLAPKKEEGGRSAVGEGARRWHRRGHRRPEWKQQYSSKRNGSRRGAVWGGLGWSGAASPSGTGRCEDVLPPLRVEREAHMLCRWVWRFRGPARHRKRRPRPAMRFPPPRDGLTRPTAVWRGCAAPQRAEGHRSSSGNPWWGRVSGRL